MNLFSRVVVLTCLFGLVVFLGVYMIRTYAFEYNAIKDKMKEPGIFSELVNTTSKATQEIGEHVDKLKEMPTAN